MRYVLAALTFAAALYFNVSAQAEKRIFIIANNADGYGIDRCLATGARLRRGRRHRLLPLARLQPGGLVPPGRPRRDHRRGAGERHGLQRRHLQRIRRHRVLALDALR